MTGRHGVGTTVGARVGVGVAGLGVAVAVGRRRSRVGKGSGGKAICSVVAIDEARDSAGIVVGVALAGSGAGVDVGNAATLHAASATVTRMPKRHKRPEGMSLIVLSGFARCCAASLCRTCVRLSMLEQTDVSEPGRSAPEK